MKIDLRHWGEVSADERAKLGDLEMRCFGPANQRPPHPLTVAGGDDLTWSVRAWDGGLLVSCLWINERTILVDGEPTRIAGIRGVRTDPAYRRRGFGRAVMHRAEEHIWREIRPALAMLHSSVMAVPFYERLGWRAIPGPVFCEQPHGRINVTELLPGNPIMVLTRDGAEPPRGVVDLCGLPF